MTTPLVARLLLDALDEFIVAAETVPEIARDAPIATMNAAAWVINHVGEGVDGMLDALIGAEQPTVRWDPDLDYVRGLQAFRCTFDRALVQLTKLQDRDTDTVLKVADRPGMPPPTIGLQLARNIGHVFGHASELHAITHAAGGELRWQLPGGADYTRGKIVVADDVGRRVRIQWYDLDTSVSDAALIAREDTVIREAIATVERVGDAERFLDREITVRRDDGTRFSFRQGVVRVASFEPSEQEEELT